MNCISLALCQKIEMIRKIGMVDKVQRKLMGWLPVKAFYRPKRDSHTSFFPTTNLLNEEWQMSFSHLALLIDFPESTEWKVSMTDVQYV